MGKERASTSGEFYFFFFCRRPMKINNQVYNFMRKRIISD
jgi:hypothetical protein